MRELQTLKCDLTKTRIVDGRESVFKLGDGEVCLKIERFAFTSNNVTYGVAGETFGYWKFFPPLNDMNNEWGCLPVWGFAEISHSKNKCLNIGERIFGYFPLASSLIVNPVKISNQSFTDGAERRKELPSVYNTYIRTSSDINYNKALDNIRALLFPLHVTAFCLCDFLQEESYYKSAQILILSASSKTAIGIAQGLAEQKNVPDVVGITSDKNVVFANNLGCYNQVFSYRNLDMINSDVATVIVDMTGNREILGALHNSLRRHMVKCITVGMTHWDNKTKTKDLLSQMMIRDRTEFFFAPAHVKKRINDWGQKIFNKKTESFMSTRIMQSREWIRVKEVQGLDNFISIYNDFASGKINPKEGIIVQL